MIAGARNRWQAILDHPILRLELRRIRRKRWWPGRRFFLFYPALLGAALGCSVMVALGSLLENTSSLISGTSVQLTALVTGVPVVCLLSVVTSLLAFALSWIAPALTASTIARERELGTLDLLRATLLTERSIVLGKLGGYLARLWPGILTLALLAPFQVVWVAGSGLFGLSYLPALMMNPVSDAEWPWVVWLALTGVVGLLRPWGDLALHAAVGLLASTVSRSSAVAIAASYSAIIALRVTFYLVTALLNVALVAIPVATLDTSDAMMNEMWMMPSLVSLGTVCVEFAGAALLVWAAVWWLKR